MIITHCVWWGLWHSTCELICINGVTIKYSLLVYWGDSSLTTSEYSCLLYEKIRPAAVKSKWGHQNGWCLFKIYFIWSYK